jgi:hypothetical protein
VHWLEVGCPFCPTVVTFPRAAGGRAVRCPECGKSYLVPSPAANAVPELPKLGSPPLAAAAGVAKPDFLANADDEDSLAATIYDPLIPPASAPRPDSPARPRSTLLPEAPGAKSLPPGLAAPPRMPPPSRPVVPVRSAAPTMEDAWEPELDRNSPLAEVPILDPPRPGRGNSGKSAVADRRRSAAAASRRTEQAARGTPGDRTPAAEPTATLLPNAPPMNVAAALEAAAEAQARMLRAEMRAKANLILLIGGTLLMIGFAFLVVKLTRG